MSTRLSICLTGLFLFLQIYLSAQDKSENYIKGDIPEFLKKDADAVCRLDEQVVEIISPGKIVVKERHIYTILNDNAEYLATYRTHYNKLNVIQDVYGSLYNSTGKELKHFKKKDMSDYAQNGDAFVSDDRMKKDGFTYNIYPFSVAFEEEDEFVSPLFLPNWYPPHTNKISLEVSRYVLTVPSDYKFRYKMVNSEIQPKITQKKDQITYVWEIRNLPVIPDEPFAISPALFDPFMLIGPTNFELQGFNGNMSDWKEYGKFYRSLQQGKDLLPDDLKKQVHVMTDNIQKPEQKVSVLYDYLQRNTHYVLIQFGIGGLQTYDANYVAKNKYGDCKALSNFMISLLKEAGIKSNPVIIWGDRDPGEFYKDFPSHQFNHVICAVPLATDTVWLECTDQYLPAGYLGEFTSNRYGLMINEDGGSLVHTPSYLLNDNTRFGNIKAVLDPEGNLMIKSTTRFQALSQDPVEQIIHHASKEEQMDYLKKKFNLPTYSVNSFQYKEDYSDRLPVIFEILDLSVNNYAHLTGKRIFINLNVLSRSTTKLPDENERKLDFQFKAEFKENDSVEIEIPKGFSPETPLKDISMETKYGRYLNHYNIHNNRIYYSRIFEQYRGVFPASDYESVKAFYNGVYESDRSQLVLVKTNN